MIFYNVMKILSHHIYRTTCWNFNQSTIGDIHYMPVNSLKGRFTVLS